MSASSVGQIYLDLGVNASGFQKQMNGITGIAKKAGKLLAGVFAVKAVTNFAKECLKLGSDLAEVQNVVDVTFGSMREQVNEFARNAITTFGLSEKVAKEYMGQLGAMSKAFGNTTEAAYEQAEALTGLTADVASFYNLSTDEAFTKMKAVYTGETEALKSLGVVMTQAALDEFALAKGYGKTTAKMSEQEKVALRLAFVRDRLSGAAGDFARTSGGWANQTRVLSLRFDALKASLGQGLINVLTPAIRLLNELMAKLQVVADGFRDFTAAIFGDAGGTEAVAEAMSSSSGDVAAGLASGEDSAKSIKKSLAPFDDFNILSSNKSGSSGSSGSSSGSNSGMGETSKDTKKASGFAEKLLKFLGDIKSKMQELANVSGLSALWEKMLISVNNTKKGISNLFDSVRNAIQNSAPSLEGFRQSVSNAFLAISSTVTTMWGDMWQKCSENFAAFTAENAPAIEEYITNLTTTFADFGMFVSGIFDDIFGSILSWWEGDGLRIFDEVLSVIDDIKKWALDLYNSCIFPIIQGCITELKRLWDEHLKPLWDDLLEFFTSVGDVLKALWDTLLKPVVDWFVNNVGPKIAKKFNEIAKFAGGLLGTIVDMVRGAIKAMTGLMTFIRGVFTLDWKLAWKGIKQYFTGIWDGIWAAVKGTVNLIIDGLNSLWSGLYSALRKIVNGVGGLIKDLGEFFGADWGWEIPAEAPKIPRLATGGYVAANTPRLAIVGDNKREGEIISPESKIAAAVAAGMAQVLSKLQQAQAVAPNRSQPVVIKIGEDDFWTGFIDFHNSVVRRTGESPLLV